MDQLLGMIENHSTAILVLLLCLIALLVAFQWLMWMFAKGRFDGVRFKPLPGKPQNIRYVITEGLVKIINDFRHLLALLLIVVFGFALFWTLYQAGGNISDIKEVLQSVIASLGGLVGTIIGYYFGEAAAKGRGEAATVGEGGAMVTAPQESPPTAADGTIKEVPPPREIKDF